MVTRTAKTPKVLGEAHEHNSVDSAHRLTAMSYEFRTPLTGILGCVQLLTDELLSPLVDSWKLKARQKKVYLKVKWPKPDHAFVDPALFISVVNHLRIPYWQESQGIARRHRAGYPTWAGNDWSATLQNTQRTS
jgi:hypothetical protein